jgi:hypothetical protein
LIIVKFALGFTTSINTILAKNPKTMDGKKIELYWQNNGIIGNQKETFPWLKHVLQLLAFFFSR